MNSNLTKNQKGAIGEHLVAAKLLEQGLDVFMANMSINNTKAYDILAVVPDTLNTHFIQVKFNSTKYFNAGMTIEQVLDKNYLSQHIVGPWIFVDGSQPNQYDYYILSKQEVIDLLYQAHDWYCNHYYRTKEISYMSPAGFKLTWLQGKHEDATKLHDAFINPITDAKDKWDKISC
ncbi:MAG: hypothetical protein MJZ28_05650 [Paludibacteraceae bacterium]|nr:hypothetical protein [Paludibacteraceae bacterium]